LAAEDLRLEGVPLSLDLGREETGAKFGGLGDPDRRSYFGRTLARRLKERLFSL
jgi:hypothetical protein